MRVRPASRTRIASRPPHSSPSTLSTHRFDLTPRPSPCRPVFRAAFPRARAPRVPPPWHAPGIPVAAVASPPSAEGLKRPRRRRPGGGFREDDHLDPPAPPAAPRPRPAARRGRAGGLGVGFAFFGDHPFPRRRGVAAQHRQRFRPLRDVRPRRALVGLAQNAQALAFRPEARVRLGLGQAERHGPRGRVVLRAPRRARRG